jgi:signal peptidase II
MTLRTHFRSLRATLLAALLVMALDQFSKYWLLYEYGMVAGVPVEVTEFFRLVMVWNHGVSFGILNKAHTLIPYALIGVALLISGLLLRLAAQSTVRLERLAYGFIIGGALGNAIDRVRVGAVADFFYFHLGALGWPAFNVADVAICVGVFTLLFFLVKKDQRP